MGGWLAGSRVGFIYFFNKTNERTILSFGPWRIRCVVVLLFSTPYHDSVFTVRIAIKLGSHINNNGTDRNSSQAEFQPICTKRRRFIYGLCSCCCWWWWCLVRIWNSLVPKLLLLGVWRITVVCLAVVSNRLVFKLIYCKDSQLTLLSNELAN